MRTLAIAVDPLLLASSLAAVLDESFEVTVCNGGSRRRCVADVAIVSETRRQDVEADTVISLPDIEGNVGTALVWHGDEATPIRIGTLRDLIDTISAVPA